MKVIFQAPPALAKIANEPLVMLTRRPGRVFFRPLSALRLYEDRIDITAKSRHGKRTYDFKRADESVN